MSPRTPVTGRRMSVRVALAIGRWLLVFMVLMLAYANLVQLPGVCGRGMLAAVSSGSYAVEARSIRLRGLWSLALRDVKVYRKGILGAPCMSSGGLVLRLSPVSLLTRRMPLSAVRAWDVRIEPGQLAVADTRKPEVQGSERSSGAFTVPVDIQDVRILGVHLPSVSGQVVSDAQSLAVRELVAEVAGAGGGAVTGELTVDERTRELRVEAAGSVDPNLLAPIFNALGWLVIPKETGRFRFGAEPPHCKLAVSHMLGGTNSLTTLRFLTRGARYRGVETRRLDGVVSVQWSGSGRGRVALRDLFVERPEGVGRAFVGYTFGSGLVEFEATGAVPPVTMLALAGVSTSAVARAVAFSGSTRTDVSGVADVRHQGRSRIRGHIAADQAEVWGMLPTSDCSMDIAVVGDTFSATNISAACCAGSLEGWVRSSGLSGAAVSNRTQVALQIKGTAFDTLCRAVGNPPRRLEGRCSLDLNLVADSRDEGMDTRGTAKVRVRDGQVYALPVFGGLTRTLGKVLPGLDFVVGQSSAKVDATIDNHKLSFSRVAVEGDVLSLSGKGGYDIGGDLDIDVQVKLMKEHTLVAKVLRALTYPVSKLFEFHVEGPLDNPRWYPVNFSGDLLRRLGLSNRAETDG